MKIGFVGCGAIGSCYASYLSKVHEVCVLDTYAPVIEAIRKNGILLDECVPGVGNGETVSYRPAMATTDPKEIGVVATPPSAPPPSSRVMSGTPAPALPTWVP